MIKVALITGGSEGLGRACVDQFRKRNWKVAVIALPGPELDNLAGDDVLAIPGDITQEQARADAVERTLQRFQRIDVLVNNAGVGLYAPPSTADVQLVKRLFDVNVFSPLALTQLVLPAMRSQKSGTIVNIGSVGGQVSLPWCVAYCASKFSLHALDDSMYREFKREGIHVIKVCPGIIETNFRQHVLGGIAPPNVAAIRRVVTPEQVASRVVLAVENGSRTVYVPAIGRVFTGLGVLAPRIMDWYLARKW